jgi:hypothetical protein
VLRSLFRQGAIAALMKFTGSIRSQSWTRRFGTFSTRIVVLLLLLAVPTLSTLARNSWYLSLSDPGHYLLTASKMKVAHPPVLSGEELLQPVVTLSEIEPEPAAKRCFIQDDAKTPLGVKIPIQIHRRPPPSSLS